MALRNASADKLTPATCNKHHQAGRWTVIKEFVVEQSTVFHAGPISLL